MSTPKKKTKPAAKPPTVAGLYLWDVKTSFDVESEIGRLWITTKHQDITAAARKAAAFLRSKNAFASDIVRIKYMGTIDA